MATSHQAPPRKRWEKMVAPRCNCEAAGPLVHEIDCPVVGLIKPVTADSIAGAIVHLNNVKVPLRRRRKQRVPPPIPSYRFILQFNFTRPVNVALWKKIKAPKGWKKNPTTAAKQETYRGVRFRCDNFKYALSPEDIELLHMKLLLSLKTN